MTRRVKIRLLRLIAALLLVVVLSFLYPQAFAPLRLEGTSLRVLDGDTIVFQPDQGASVRVRLSNIDAPETNQPYGKESGQALAAMIDGKHIVVEVEDQDHYGRTVGVIYEGEKNICRAMVQQGMAWAYRDYLNDVVYLVDERAARNQKLGLWSLAKKDREPPWRWRKKMRN